MNETFNQFKAEIIQAIVTILTSGGIQNFKQAATQVLETFKLIQTT